MDLSMPELEGIAATKLIAAEMPSVKVVILTASESDATLFEGVVSNRKLAKRLDLSENTVKFHVRNILDKLRLHNRAEAVGYALRKRIDPTT